MLGIIVEAQTNVGELPNRIFYKFGPKTVLERSLAACVKCDYAHQIVLAMPSADKALIHGNVFQGSALPLATIGYMDRGVKPIFYGRQEESLSRLYYAALTANLTTIVRVNAENVLIPTWLINGAIKYYLTLSSPGYLVVGAPEYGDGFDFEIFPFWMLAEAHIYCDDQLELSAYLKKTFDRVRMPNEGPNHIPNVIKSLRFNDRSQVAVLGGLLEEIDLGADLGGLVGELNE